MEFRGLSSVSNGSSESMADEGVNTPSTSGDEGRADARNHNEVLKRQRGPFPEGTLMQDDSSKSGDGSDQGKRQITDSEGFASSAKSSTDEKSSNDDKSSSDDKSTNGDKSSSDKSSSNADSDRSNEYNDGNNASASSSDNESNSEGKHRNKPMAALHRQIPSDPQTTIRAPAQRQGEELIELLDSDPEKTETSDGIQVKKQRTGEPLNFPGQQQGNPLGTVQLAQQLEQIYHAVGGGRGVPIQPGATIPGVPARPNPTESTGPPPIYQVNQLEKPVYVSLDSANLPTWRTLVPPPVAYRKPPPTDVRLNHQRRFRLSLLNVNEFTITGLPTYMDGPPTPLTNLRTAIRQISRDHGKAVFDRDKEGGGGKWRIPLGAYHAFVGFLRGHPNTYVEGIPQHQLQIASLEKARQEKGYPTVEDVIEMGVPAKLANALAPFQRGGVDFVCEKDGRALIADDMGLGKTIQGIASMSMYADEWPLLVLSPSSARYHWAAECRKWLARKTHGGPSSGGIEFEGAGPQEQISSQADDIKLLDHDQVHVLTSSKDPILPQPNTRVVVCSYGLAPALIASGKLTPGLFKCAIVDESHMLKNKSAKRTLALIPVLRATSRCVLLSGTPALARPAELWPQLEIIGTEQHGWWEDESQFIDRYVKNASAERRAELHTLLVGTVMIRRLKLDILKTLPHKLREKAIVKLLSKEKRTRFKDLILLLKESKGALGKIARKHDTFSYDNDSESEHFPHASAAMTTVAATSAISQPQGMQESRQIQQADAERMLHEYMRRQLDEGRARIQAFLASLSRQLTPPQLDGLRQEQENTLRIELEEKYKEGLARTLNQYSGASDETRKGEEAENERKNLLSRLYALTGDVKAPLVVEMLEKWLNDPTKGKVCIFAHHLSVLDAIGAGAKLSNDSSSTRKFIRIDGSTSPKMRQQQIDDFQTDSSIRVALLGITAAGVAVTLTASSTVWFAELFWTPALMIQAEDRVHRIGQASQVRALYVVAKGTLDDVLWKLIEKKFQDLGEFVEGKEKLKMVVHKVYNNTKDLFSIFQTDILGFDENEEDGFLDDIDFDDEDIEKEIEDFAAEETNMVKDDVEGDEDDENPAAESEGSNQKPSAVDMSSSTRNQAVELGGTEEAAITLSDSEDENDGENPSTRDVARSAGSAQMAPAPEDTPLTDCKMYQMTFPGSSIGVEVCEHRGRILVDSIGRERRNRLGPDSKPSTGDVFVAINNVPCPMNWQSKMFRQFVQHAFSNATRPVRVTFAEVPSIQEEFLQLRAEREKEKAKLKEEEKERRKQEHVDPSEIIEIESDDEKREGLH
uniref:Helicase ATP-binding domain-containing protein n=1 Tax=Amphora coffeiformis TaxID=265554 RepID=A0A7S3P599_9STRA